MEVDGHDPDELNKAFDKAKEVQGKPQVIIAHTEKGKGVSFIENKAEWHGVAPNEEELEKALSELDEIEKQIDIS
jgi:transketolase